MTAPTTSPLSVPMLAAVAGAISVGFLLLGFLGLTKPKPRRTVAVVVGVGGRRHRKRRRAVRRAAERAVAPKTKVARSWSAGYDRTIVDEPHPPTDA